MKLLTLAAIGALLATSAQATPYVIVDTDETTITFMDTQFSVSNRVAKVNILYVQDRVDEKGIVSTLLTVDVDCTKQSIAPAGALFITGKLEQIPVDTTGMAGGLIQPGSPMDTVQRYACKNVAFTGVGQLEGSLDYVVTTARTILAGPVQ